eukprot:3418568-Prymnesium_polylepis.1
MFAAISDKLWQGTSTVRIRRGSDASSSVKSGSGGSINTPKQVASPRGSDTMRRRRRASATLVDPFRADLND